METLILFRTFCLIIILKWWFTAWLLYWNGGLLLDLFIYKMVVYCLIRNIRSIGSAEIVGNYLLDELNGGEIHD